MRRPSIVILSATGAPVLTDRRLLPQSARFSCFDYSAAKAEMFAGADLCILEVATANSAALEAIRSTAGLIATVLIVKEGSEALAVSALHAGVRHYHRSNDSAREFQDILDSLLSERSPSDGPEFAERFVGDSAPVRKLRGEIARAARCQSNVLITGETGTGKELVAEIIHRSGARGGEPFVCLNSTAIPDSLIESELFGYDRGAFTGAFGANSGKLASGNRGSVFFDEIGDVSPSLQAKLLRALDRKIVYRLGSNKPVPLDIRVLAATNQDLEAAIRSQRFRSDLYYRLNVIRLQVPPLRDRSEDIPGLLAHFIAEFNQAFGAEVVRFTEQALETLTLHEWPGNVRELRNVVEAAFANLPDPRARVAELPPNFTITPASPRAERAHILNALASNGWNKSKAAEQLRWSRMTLYRKLTRLKIEEPPKPLFRRAAN